MTPGSAGSTGGTPRIFISAAEPSGDRHAASLIRAIRTQCPAAQFLGVAGPLMQAAGCLAIEDWTRQSAMLVGAVRLAGRAYRLVHRVRRLLQNEPCDLAILVDSPALHLPMARHVKAAGCPVLYYIAPQLWAWAPWRIGRVRRRVDRLAAILPFEETYFRQRGVHASFVGHPLVEQLTADPADPAAVQWLKTLGQPLVACLPGSRQHVIREVLPGQIEVAQGIAKQYPKAGFVFAAASPEAENTIRARLGTPPFPLHIVTGRTTDLLAAADLALCASGTATLEVAWHRLPMVVMYNGSKWGYRLVGRWLITTPHLCLVNILAGRRVVPEFMPYYVSTAPILAEALDILRNDERRETMQHDLDAIIGSLGTDNAAERTACMALDMLGVAT